LNEEKFRTSAEESICGFFFGSESAMAIFRKSCALFQAVDLIGIQLYADRWTLSEYKFSKPKLSPDELEQQRRPLLQTIEKLERKKTEIEIATSKTLDTEKNRELGRAKDELEAEIRGLHVQLGQLPDPAVLPQFYEPYCRYEQAKSVLLDAIRTRQLRVHNGRGGDINPLVWQDDRRFRCYLELSIVVNSKTAGPPRVQPAFIDEVEFNLWLKTLIPIVPLPQKITIEEQNPSIDELVAKFIERKRNEEKNGAPHPPKWVMRKEAITEIPKLTGRGFDQCWTRYAPTSWRAPGAPKKKS